MLSRSGKKEGIDFKHNKWIYYVVMAAVLGAVSGLYDKYLMAPVDQGGIGLDRMIVQSWYNIYQLFMMGGVLMLLWWPKRQSTTPFHWHWCIILISIFLSAADFVLFLCLKLGRCNDFHSIYGKAWQCACFFSIWCNGIP